MKTTHEDSQFKIALVGRAKNGALWELAEQFGSAKKLAEHLGVSYSQFMQMLNMSWFPGEAVRGTEKWRKIEEKLLVLTGKDLADLFPPELRVVTDSAGLKFAVVKEIPTCAIAEAAHLQLPPAQEAEIERGELREKIEKALESLTPRESQVMRMRFGFDGPEMALPQVASRFGITPERVRQIEAKALRKLRHSTRAKELKPFVE